MNEPILSNVSDTARWVATYRAAESSRTDALFRDPYAERLAGERGKAIAASAPRSMRTGWPIVMRTKSMDDLVLASVADGCDCVLCLAAGFDTRPYRLALPVRLRWIEADLPAITEEKEQLLAGEKPSCQVVREKVDLADASARAAFLDRSLVGVTKALVLTEGLLVYLTEDVVRDLSRDLTRPAIKWWMFDTVSPPIRATLMREMKTLSRAPMLFAPPNGVAFFEALGWKARDIVSSFHEALRLKRLPPLLRFLAMLPFPPPDPRNVAKAPWSAVVRLERDEMHPRDGLLR
jgi:methyltransferase (TIGR00027 family)